MLNSCEKQGTTQKAVAPDLLRWIDGFLVSCRARGLSDNTTAFYAKRVAAFAAYCGNHGQDTVEALDAGLVREWILSLQDGGHNPGGVHSYFRVLRTFLRWWEGEAAPDGWRNPIKKVKAPKVPEKILDPAGLDDVGRLLAVCGNDREGLRDRALLLTLLDTGARAGEITAFDLADLDQVTGSLIVQHGKRDKRRVVLLGQKARRAIRAYIREREDETGPLFATRSGERLTYSGLRSIVTRLAASAGVKAPSLHAFRRAFAIEALRGGADLLTIQRLLGHADLSLLRRYAKQTTADLQKVHAAISPADRL